MTRIIEQLSDISANYDAMFVDLWGCVHDGVRAIPSAVAALQAYRKAGGRVILVTNAPRPRAGVQDQIEKLGVPGDAWDSIATSGDAARMAMFQGVVGSRLWFMGEETDMGFFEPLNAVEEPVLIERVELEDAEGIVCCGPFDRHAAPETVRPELLLAQKKGLKLLCANPDIVVDRGETREWCAGAVAELYTEMGGVSLYFGKPHPPIYDLARRRLSELVAGVEKMPILAVGDGIATDIKGALGEDIDSLFITGGLARQETKTADQPDPEALEAYLAEARISPTFSIGTLR